MSALPSPMPEPVTVVINNTGGSEVDRLLKYREVAYLLGIPAKRVYALEDLPSVQLPGSRSRRWRLSDVQAYLRALPVLEPEPAPEPTDGPTPRLRRPERVA